MNVETRQRIERRIARATAKALIAAGYKVAVFDGEEIALQATDSERDIIGAMFSTDEDYLFVYPADSNERIGWVRFIYGNDGWDVINDYTTNLESCLQAANELADELERRHA
ncbi:hypothetical protein H8593_004264 [Salmonella enterica subsp. enterica serovar Give]|nr:hypothetical protein [Salmonella enterica subsp. enterica serovar Give]